MASLDSAAQSFNISDAKHHFEYQLSSERKVLRGIATMTQSQRDVKDAGAIVTLHYFDAI